MIELVLVSLLVTSVASQQPSTVPAAQANTASVQRTSGNSVVRLRQPAAAYQPQPSQPSFHHDNLLSEEESNNRPREPYNFGYDIKDEFGNQQYRKEESDAQGAVRGTYGYTDANGIFRFVDYIADVNGFRASIRSNEPGIGNAQAANIVLNSEQPPQSIFNAPIPAAPRPLFPSREPRNRGFTSFDINHAAASSEQVVRNERLRYSFPLPSRGERVPSAVDSEQPTASSAPAAATSTTAQPLFRTGLFADRISGRSSADIQNNNSNGSNRQ